MMMAAYAIVYFPLRFAMLAFWLIFTTLLLPLEVPILPSYEAIQKLGLTNTYTGLIIPLIASMAPVHGNSLSISSYRSAGR